MRDGQRARLLRAIVEEAVAAGYPNTKIGGLADRAGVSRATFYEQFASKEACFLAAYAEQAVGLSDAVAHAIANNTGGHPEQAAVDALVAFAHEQPHAFTFLTHEAMLVGPPGLAARDGLITRLGGEIDKAWGAEREGAGSPLPPSARLLVGGLIRMLGIRMRRGDPPQEGELTEAVARLDYRDVLAQAQRWALFAGVQPAELAASGVPLAPQPLPRGRHRLPAKVASRVQRERILHATAEAIREKGYAKLTVADIVATAGLSREAFYGNFRDKHEAFTATHRLVFEQFVAVSAGAFYMSSSAWPERVWEGGRAFTSLVAEVPSFAHFAFVESYALGPAIAQSTDEGIMAFTLFLDEGYRYSPRAAEVPRIVSQLIAGTIMETASLYVREGRAGELPGLLPLVAYMILAPFTGPDAARELVDEKVREAEKPGTSETP